MVYVAGEEMTRYTMQLILNKTDRAARGHVQVGVLRPSRKEPRRHRGSGPRPRRHLRNAPASRRSSRAHHHPHRGPGEGLGLKKPLDLPNAHMRRGWNGKTISRDTIHIEGMELGYKRPVLSSVTPSAASTFAGVEGGRQGSHGDHGFVPAEGEPPSSSTTARRGDAKNAVVTYHK